MQSAWVKADTFEFDLLFLKDGENYAPVELTPVVFAVQDASLVYQACSMITTVVQKNGKVVMFFDGGQIIYVGKQKSRKAIFL